MSLGVHSAGGKPGMNPPGRPSVTSTTATRWVGMLAMRWRANISAPVSAGPVGV